ncbi:glutaredoxin family protein [Miniphocaeibacter halophilus]|uniref:Glutathione S-transferase domain-containing protein n=1 Tax=Miniphocaeibacter halophilus TaxID=2931922 RepID=A0AC61MYK6_9FIRM|nr:glutathione S-transferase N-terminal domain-containing protein [Miniphocaeibacter halophilus]QQK08461.1 glutathione S-transferase domain-containing protein [Miniphocaeibacter halophilus]
MTKLELFYKDVCPYCQKVFRFIDKYNLRDKITFTNISSNPADKDRLIEVGGSVQVPCLFIDDKPMYESSDIIEYLKNNLVK